MGNDFKRSEERKSACIHAFVSDLADICNVKCIIRDASLKGCRIVSSRIQELPDVIQITPEGLERPIRGVIVWRNGNMAGVCFEHGCSDEVRSDIQQLYESVLEEEEDDVLVLGRRHEPLSYSERLTRYYPPRK